jgi:hypothetical protein
MNFFPQEVNLGIHGKNLTEPLPIRLFPSVTSIEIGILPCQSEKYHSWDTEGDHVVRTYPGSRICESDRVGTTFICTRKEEGKHDLVSFRNATIQQVFWSFRVLPSCLGVSKKNHHTFTTRLPDVHTRAVARWIYHTCGCAVRHHCICLLDLRDHCFTRQYLFHSLLSLPYEFGENVSDKTYV